MLLFSAFICHELVDAEEVYVTEVTPTDEGTRGY